MASLDIVPVGAAAPLVVPQPSEPAPVAAAEAGSAFPMTAVEFAVTNRAHRDLGLLAPLAISGRFPAAGGPRDVAALTRCDFAAFSTSPDGIAMAALFTAGDTSLMFGCWLPWRGTAPLLSAFAGPARLLPTPDALATLLAAPGHQIRDRQLGLLGATGTHRVSVSDGTIAVSGILDADADPAIRACTCAFTVTDARPAH